ncbi:DUF3971 domain-containing protein [Octadecabacter sp. R77987]|uniref:YhdP family protein n=1 Tax=Octadecabacter sp. R77987 TaxID=3093874 RepID=UPI00366BE0A2
MTDPQTPDDPPRTRRIKKRHIARTVVLLAGLPVLFGVIGVVMMLGREITAPTWIKTRVEARVAEVLDGASLRFGKIFFTVGTDLHPRIRLTNAVLRDGDGTPIARFPEVEGQLSPRGLIRGEVLAQEVHLQGAQINLRRAGDGTVAVAFGGSAATVTEAASLTALLDEFDQVFDRSELAALERVQADGLIVNFDDARAGRSWTVDGGQLDLDLRGDQTALRGEVALLSGRSYVTVMSLSYTSPRRSSAADISLEITDAAAVDLATQSPALSWLAVIEAPISATLRASIDEQGALGPLNALLEIGQGDLRPTNATRPIRFDQARTYLTFDPVTDEVTFSYINVQSGWGSFQGQGNAYLREFSDGWPAAILAQLSLSEMQINPAGIYAQALDVGTAIADFRLRLDPFTLTLGQAVLQDENHRATFRGEVLAAPDGWQVSLDGAMDSLSRDRLMAVWPALMIPRTRAWFDDNLLGADFSGLRAAFRLLPDQPPVVSITTEFDDLDLRYIKALPPITGGQGLLTYDGTALSVALDRGIVTPAEGGRMVLDGSTFIIPDARIPEPPAQVDLQIASTVTAALAILDHEPFGFISKAGLETTLADGRAQIAAQINLPLRSRVPREEIIYSASATLRDVQSSVLVPGRRLAASELALEADNAGMAISGPLRIGAVPATVRWQQAFGPDNGGRSTLTGSVELSQRFADEFNIGLPRGTISGAATADVTINLRRDTAPAFELASSLNGLGLQLPALGWRKEAGSRGDLRVAGTLGAVPDVSSLSINAGGLQAAGAISISANGGLDAARFSRVQMGGWLDAPIILRGRGAGRPALVMVAGGVLDLRNADFGDSGGQGGPMEIALETLQISEGIALTDFRGEFDSAGGFSGGFVARVNGGAAVQGTVVPRRGRSAVRIVSDDAGGVFRAAGLLRNAQGGAMDLTLLPAGGEGSYDGTLAATNLRVRDAPALAGLLNAISVVGLLQQLDGQGLAFSNVDAQFRITPDRIIITQSSAVGPGLGLSLDGVYRMADRTMDFQGVVSPIYLLNGIGSFLTRPGEGFIGFNFTLRGPADSARIAVNPLSALTPGMFREIFRRPPPQVGQ